MSTTTQLELSPQLKQVFELVVNRYKTAVSLLAVRQEMRTANKPFAEKAKPLLTQIKQIKEKLYSLGEDASPNEFKETWLSYRAVEAQKKAIQAEAKEVLSPLRERASTLQKVIKITDQQIISALTELALI